MPGIKVGHLTLERGRRAARVILAPPNTVGAVDVRGGAPATVETDLLRPDELVSTINAIVLAGGSAFGLDARGGVMKYLEEQKIGYAFGGAFVPIVSGAAIFDLRRRRQPEGAAGRRVRLRGRGARDDGPCV